MSDAGTQYKAAMDAAIAESIREVQPVLTTEFTEREKIIFTFGFVRGARWQLADSDKSFDRLMEQIK